LTSIDRRLRLSVQSHKQRIMDESPLNCINAREPTIFNYSLQCIFLYDIDGLIRRYSPVATTDLFDDFFLS
jgi:hypothetical protein